LQQRFSIGGTSSLTAFGPISLSSWRALALVKPVMAETAAEHSPTVIADACVMP
jgi:hypothetical protein